MTHLIINYNYILELLEDVIKQTPLVATELIVCSTKEEFLSQVLDELHQHDIEHEPPPPQPLTEDNSAEEASITSTSDHILLSRTLHVISSSQHVKLIFCPTITVFRGYLSGYVSNPTVVSERGPIFILNLLAMHHGTSEFTLQGLSQTFATAVSAAHCTNRVLNMIECKDINDPSNPNRGPVLWQAEVQLLSAAVKIGEAGQNWGRRTVQVRKIASRWFRFEERKVPDRLKRTAGFVGHTSEDEMLV